MHSVFISFLIAAVFTACSSTPKKKEIADAPPEITDRQAHEIGVVILDELYQKYKGVEDKNLLEYINKVGQYTAHHMEVRADKVSCPDRRQKLYPVDGFRFAVVRSKEPFSMALPGGYIIVSEGLVAKLKSEDQLAGVLAAEVQHSVCRSGQAAFIYSAPQAREGNAVEFVQSQMDRLIKERPTPKAMQSADRAAIIMMTRAGYYAHHYPIYLKDMMDGGDKIIYSESRVAGVKAIIARLKVAEKTTDARRARFDSFRNSVVK